MDDHVFVPKTAEVRGTEFHRNTFVVLQTGIETEENLPVFGKIWDIVVVHSSVVVLAVHVWTTLFFNENLRSFAVEEVTVPDLRLVVTSDLADYRPISPWKSLRDGDSHTDVCLRTSFFSCISRFAAHQALAAYGDFTK